MKVYIVEAFSAEPYEHGTWVHGVYDSLEKAKAELGDSFTVYNREVCMDTGNILEWGYMLLETIGEYEVQ